LAFRPSFPSSISQVKVLPELKSTWQATIENSCADDLIECRVTAGYFIC
jgi:hypothetical protein